MFRLRLNNKFWLGFNSNGLRLNNRFRLGFNDHWLRFNNRFRLGFNSNGLRLNNRFRLGFNDHWLRFNNRFRLGFNSNGLRLNSYWFGNRLGFWLNNSWFWLGHRLRFNNYGLRFFLRCSRFLWLNHGFLGRPYRNTQHMPYLKTILHLRIHRLYFLNGDII